MNKLLIVEDNDNDMILLLVALRGCPLEVIKCTTAAQARALCLSHVFHAALVNLTLPYPEPDGIYLVRWMRAHDPRMIIHIVTGAEDPRRRAQAIEAGAQGFFTKPYTSDDNKLLLGQLQATRAAYQHGKRMKHWRTTYGGAFTATGAILFGGPMALSQTSFVVPTHMMQFCIWTGLIMAVVGYFLTQLATADKKVVENNLKEQRSINLEELGVEPPKNQ